jgi:hypothetical protein
METQKAVFKLVWGGITFPFKDRLHAASPKAFIFRIRPLDKKEGDTK